MDVCIMCKKFEINMLRNSGDTTSFNFLSHNAHAYSISIMLGNFQGGYQSEGGESWGALPVY